MIRVVSCLAALQVLSLAAPPARAVQEEARALVYAPKDGTRLARTIQITQALELVSMAQGPAAGELRRGAGDLRLDTRLELELDDDLLAVAEGRPVKLKRRFRAGRFHAEFGPRAANAARAKHAVLTPLEGVGVLYTWSPEERVHGRFYDEKEAMEEFLAHLTEDADLRALLPAKPVRPNETWILEPARLADVFAPGGRLPWAWPKELDRPMVRSLSTGLGGGLGELFGGTARGKAEATLLRIETRAGAEVAIVKLALEDRKSVV